MRLRILTFIAGLVFLAVPVSASSPEELFREATETFRRALKASEKDPERAQALYDEAIARFEALARSGRRNAPLFTNLGNAYLLRGDLGRAILNFRRAEAFSPSDPALQENLRAARSRREVAIESEAKGGLLSTLLFWHYEIQPGLRFMAFLVFVLILGLSLLLRGTKRLPKGLRFVPVLSLVLGLALLASLVVEDTARRGRREGVLLTESLGRKGPDGHAYRPSFSAPLSPGVEFCGLEEREGWWRIALRDGRETWVLKSACAWIEAR